MERKETVNDRMGGGWDDRTVWVGPEEPGTKPSQNRHRKGNIDGQLQVPRVLQLSLEKGRIGSFYTVPRDITAKAPTNNQKWKIPLSLGPVWKLLESFSGETISKVVVRPLPWHEAWVAGTNTAGVTLTSTWCCVGRINTHLWILHVCMHHMYTPSSMTLALTMTFALMNFYCSVLQQQSTQSEACSWIKSDENRFTFVAMH